MGRRTPDLTGRHFGRLLALTRDYSGTTGHAKWTCLCDPRYGGCSTVVSVSSNSLRSGNTQSCGCLQRERTAKSNIARTGTPRRAGSGRPRSVSSTTRADRRLRAYGSWSNMIRRCTRESDPRYKDWGGRGITVEPRWLDFANFYADMGERPPGMSLERKDNDGNYCRENCVWATPHQQQVNSRAFKLTPDVVAEIKRLRATGMTLIAISEILGLNRHTVSRALSGKTRQRSKTS